MKTQCSTEETLSSILHFTDGLKEERNGQWIGLCPAHNDKNPSLSICKKSDGKILLKCQAGCKTEDVLKEYGLTFKDLNPHTEKKRSGGFQIDATYDYHDTDGALLYQVCRLDPKDFRQRQPLGDGGWTWTTKGIKRVPYRLQELQSTNGDTWVFIVEGEKDADLLTSHDLTATCNVGGAGKWLSGYNQYFGGRNVAILPDNDEQGKEHAQQVAKQLKYVAKDVRIVELEDLPDKGDISDWFDTGGTVDALMLRVREAKSINLSTLEEPEVPVAGVWTNLADVKTTEVEWLWPNRFPLGKLSIIAGNPALGKSFLSLDIAARVSTGAWWPDGAENKVSGSVVLLSAEDDLNDTIAPRLIAANADLNKIHALKAVVREKDDGEKLFNMMTDLRAIEDKVKQLTDCRLITVDPITAYMGRIDSHRNAEVRAVLAPLAKLAAEYHCSVIGVSHLTKMAGPQAIHRILGSVAFVAAARAVWLVTKDDNDNTRRLFLPCKTNLSINPESLAFSVIDGQVIFDDVPVDMTADEALNPEMKEEKTKLIQTKEWILEVLAGGEVDSRDINKMAAENDISKGTLARAKDKLKAEGKIKVDRIGWSKLGYWTWKLTIDTHSPNTRNELL